MGFTHFNEQGLSKMVDISSKDVTLRTAVATAFVKVNIDTLLKIKEGTLTKGNVLSVAQVAGIMAAKNTSNAIPMCHNINLNGVDINFTYEDDGIRILTNVKCKGKTGVEMEALHCACITALTIYDMCKAVQKDIEITDIHLVSKTGGKSGEFIFKR